jgi:hypothetical protein
MKKDEPKTKAIDERPTYHLTPSEAAYIDLIDEQVADLVNKHASLMGARNGALNVIHRQQCLTGEYECKGGVMFPKEEGSGDE